MEEKEWTRVNDLLRQHGHPVVDIVCIDDHHMRTVVLTFDSAKSLLHTLFVLFQDGDRQQRLIQEMLKTNTQLREELKAQTNISRKYEDRTKALQTDLNESYHKLKEYELVGTKNPLVAEKGPQATSSSMRSLLEKCDAYEKEIHRLTTKLRKLNGAGAKQLLPERKVSYEPRYQTSWKNGRTDNKSTYKTELHRQKEASNHEEFDDFFLSSSSTDSEQTSAMMVPVEICEKKLSEMRKKLNVIASENEKLKSELLLKPNTKDVGEAMFKIKQLQQRLIEKKDGILVRDHENKHFSTLVENMTDLPAQVCKQYLKLISDKTESSDLNLILPKLEQMKRATDAFLHMEQFAKEVLLLTEKCDVQLFPGIQQSSVQRDRDLYYALPTLEFWVAQLNQLKNLQLSIKNLAERLFPWKPVKLEEATTVCRLIRFVDSLTYDDEETLAVLMTQNCMIHEEPVPKKTLKGMVRHFQNLFSVPWIFGVYAKMSDIYRKIGEMHNVMKNLKEFLGLGENASAGAVVDAVASLCETRNRQIEDHLSRLFHTDDISSILRKIQKQDEMLSAFDEVCLQLMTLLNVQSLNEIVPTVCHLVDAHTF